MYSEKSSHLFYLECSHLGKMRGHQFSSFLQMNRFKPEWPVCCHDIVRTATLQVVRVQWQGNEEWRLTTVPLSLISAPSSVSFLVIQHLLTETLQQGQWFGFSLSTHAPCPAMEVSHEWRLRGEDGLWPHACYPQVYSLGKRRRSVGSFSGTSLSDLFWCIWPNRHLRDVSQMATSSSLLPLLRLLSKHRLLWTAFS